MNNYQTSSIAQCSEIEELDQITEASAVVCQRKLSQLMALEVEHLMEEGVFQGIKLSGNMGELRKRLEVELIDYPLLFTDTARLLELFSTIIKPESIRMVFMPVRNGMCRKFHTDFTDYRLLCSYKGVGTEYIRPENVREGTELYDKSQIERLTQGDVLLFRGALSSTDDLPPLLHKSPSVNAKVEHRLLFRLDTNVTAWQ